MEVQRGGGEESVGSPRGETRRGKYDGKFRMFPLSVSCREMGAGTVLNENTFQIHGFFLFIDVLSAFEPNTPRL
jgi:hypothetical protein